MARAFFYAGARSLLVSHWSVYDDVAPRITNDLIALRRADASLSKAQALQRAMRAVREDTRDDSLAFPSAWAPFVVVGDAAR
jgi:CHAT domain-containing protein